VETNHGNLVAIVKCEDWNSLDLFWGIGTGVPFVRGVVGSCSRIHVDDLLKQRWYGRLSTVSALEPRNCRQNALKNGSVEIYLRGNARGMTSTIALLSGGYRWSLSGLLCRRLPGSDLH
jgi:hypothetical protein